MVRIALSIAGSDPSGGAGIQGDLKVFHAHGVYGQAAITLLTAQNSLGVQANWPVDEAQVEAQLTSLWEDMAPHAIKTGAMPSAAVVARVARSVVGRSVPVVVDPILAPSRGAGFSEHDLASAYRTYLVPLAALVTPNADEARALTGIHVRDADTAALAGHGLCALGAAAALIKGGHLAGNPVDVLCLADGFTQGFAYRRVETMHAHGTGCALSAAIASRLALGERLVDAVRGARAWLQRALTGAPGLGAGRGPLNHFARV